MLLKRKYQPMVSKKFEHIRQLLEKIEVDVDKFENNNNKSAGVRVRKSMQEIKVLAQEIRKQILDKTRL